MIKLNEINILLNKFLTKCKNKCDKMRLHCENVVQFASAKKEHMKIFQISMENSNALCNIKSKTHTLNKNSRNHLHHTNYSVHSFVR